MCACVCARVCAALFVQHAMRYYTVICDLSGSNIFLHIIVQTARFPEKRVTEHKMCVL